ncbi:NAD-P-binding protein [Dentipellis sp. KUC8613]|nr:NAD-P-binding protein [Dentipellis sp. KUC8613]
MSTFSRFAIAGAGNLGAFVAEELLNLKASGKVKEVTVLTRSSGTNSTLDKLASKGAKIATVDYTSKASLTAALSGVDVAISTLSLGPGFEAQDAVAVAAKAAGVRLFLPSEFGNATDELTEGLLYAKTQFHARLRELGLPYLLVFTGEFTDFVFIPFVDLDINSGKVTVGGDGNTPLSWTSRTDIGRFVAHALTTLPPNELNNKIFRIEGDRLSFNEVFKQYEAKTRKKIAVAYRSIAELEAAVKANGADFSSFFHLAWAQGGGLTGKKEDLANGLFPGWNPKKVIDVIAP